MNIKSEKNNFIVNFIENIEKKCFSDFWTGNMIENQLNNENTLLVLKNYGYAIGVKIIDECELYRIAVLPEFRGKHYGEKILNEFLEICRGRVFLEVNENNETAINLYKKCGFNNIAKRKKYYDYINNEDALIWEKVL